MKNYTKWLKNLLFTIFLLIFALVTISLFQSNNAGNEVRNIFGYTILNVLTGSMEPSIKPGDIAIVKLTDQESINIGDIITYRSDESLVTHRVIDIQKESGTTLFITQGDANNTIDEEPVSPNQLIGSYVFKIPKLGYLIDFIKTPFGTFITVFLVLSALVIDPLKKYVLSRNQQKAS